MFKDRPLEHALLTTPRIWTKNIFKFFIQLSSLSGWYCSRRIIFCRLGFHTFFSSMSSSLHNIILNTMRVVLVLWRLLPTKELSLSYSCAKKSSCGDWKFTLDGWSFYFPLSFTTFVYLNNIVETTWADSLSIHANPWTLVHTSSGRRYSCLKNAP